MSFSFRNIFSPDDPEFETSTDSPVSDGFTAPGSPGRGKMETGTPSAPPTQTFLASELLPYIPKAIAAQSGIPMEKELHVPLPSDGTLDVPLSAIYQLCPELFAAEITPLNDSVVTLPPRLGATPAAGSPSEFARNPFSGKVGAPTSADGPGENPFWSPLPASAPAATSASPAKENPFSSDVPPVKNAFSSPENVAPGDSGNLKGHSDAFVMPKAENAFAAFPPFETPSSKEGDGAQGFATLFSKQADADADLPFPKASAFSLDTEEPEKESEGVWGAMFSGKAIEEGEPTQDAAAGFADAPFENIGKLLNQASAAPKEKATPPASPSPAGPAEGTPPGFSAPCSPAAGTAGFPALDSSGTFATGFTAFSPASAGEGEKKAVSQEKPGEMSWSFDSPAPPSEAARPVALGFSLPDPPAPPVAASEPALPAPPGFSGAFVSPAPAASPIPPSTPSVEKESPAPAGEAPAPESDAAPFSSSVVLEPTAAAPAFSAALPPAIDKTASSPEDDRDLELRAIFSTSESFTLSKVARKIVGLPGIQSCSLSLPGKLVQASRKEENRVGDEAREMVATLRSLAKLTGLPEARTFTLQTDRGIVSLFLEGECCVTVHHDASAFQPGVREKLILVARNLAKLRE